MYTRPSRVQDGLPLSGCVLLSLRKSISRCSRACSRYNRAGEDARASCLALLPTCSDRTAARVPRRLRRVTYTLQTQSLHSLSLPPSGVARAGGAEGLWSRRTPGFRHAYTRVGCFRGKAASKEGMLMVARVGRTIPVIAHQALVVPSASKEGKQTALPCVVSRGPGRMYFCRRVGGQQICLFTGHYPESVHLLLSTQPVCHWQWDMHSVRLCSCWEHSASVHSGSGPNLPTHGDSRLSC
jgi:hypothetical protein